MAYMSPVIKLAGKNPHKSIFIVTFFMPFFPYLYYLYFLTLKATFMRTRTISVFEVAGSIFLLIFLTGFQAKLKAQDDRSITIYQYRRVPDNKIDEFIKRETTYWSKVAEK